MSGTFRLLLALLVAISHLVQDDRIGHFGHFAVRGFFVLSGFAITAALNEGYHFDMRRFWANRLLRLLPMYLLACLATALVICTWPDEAGVFMPRWSMAHDWTDVAQNLLIIPLAFENLQFRYVEPAWSIAVELVMYILLCLGIARTERSAFLAFCVGTIYHCIALYADVPFGLRYFGIEAAIPSFCMGALAYFSLKRGVFRPSAGWVAFTGIIWLTNLLFANGSAVPADYDEDSGFYLNTLLVVPLVVGLSLIKPGAVIRKIDGFLGELAYPFFLTQWIGGFLAHQLLLPSEWRGCGLAFAAAPIILAISAVFVLMQNWLVEPTRDLIRGKDPQTDHSSARNGLRRTSSWVHP
ncbi:MAG: acyltransferase 3 [Hyphomicrobiales bacterium]|nr:acyltransferase 3 [Hyphomicrobiales bacterium]